MRNLYNTSFVCQKKKIYLADNSKITMLGQYNQKKDEKNGFKK